MVADPKPRVDAYWQQRKTLVSASSCVLSNSSTLSFVGIPFTNLIRYASLSTVMHISLSPMILILSKFVDQSTKNRTKSILLEPFDKNFSNWLCFCCSRLVGLILISPTADRFLLSKFFVENVSYWSVVCHIGPFF